MSSPRGEKGPRLAIGRNLQNKLRLLPVNLAAKISALGPVRRRMDARYRQALTRHQHALPSLCGLDLEICEGLQKQGLFVTSLEALNLALSAEIRSAGIIATGQQLAQSFAAEARRRSESGETFLMVPPSAMLAEPQLFAWGVQDRLLDIVEAYLGLPPAYDGMTIIYTVANGDEEATRRWHRDREDRRMVKIIIYLNDVIAGEGGPFQLDPASDAANIAADHPAPIMTCEGKAGTVIFTDTARFLHRGQPASKTDRAAIFYSYFSQRPLSPFYCERSGLSRKQIAALAAGASARQRASILWREHLPWPLRVLPSAPI